MKINFNCIELTIQDEELGCNVTLSDTKSADDQFKTMDEIMNSTEKYFLIQRTYAEDEYDEECYHIESSETNASFDSSYKIKIKISKDVFEAKWLEEKVIIGLNLKNNEHQNLIDILKNSFNKKVILSTNNS